MTRMKPRLSQAGFTIVEVAMAIGIMTMGAVGTASVLMTTRSAEANTATDRMSVKIAQDLMEKID
ncbi:MAG: hypothetical protein KDB53_13050, partial [Planctomycetes bacterium]|nr:hypothetical protein [Planctomycetota bacterium]